MKKLGFILIILPLAFLAKAQTVNCTFKAPQIIIDFGTGNVNDPNSGSFSEYRRVGYSCPTDGHYSFSSYTIACFHDDWHNLSEDHTAGDVDGNMLLVNAAPDAGVFLRIPVAGLKSNTVYELSLWLMNLCKPTKKCPFPLLPNLNIQLQTLEGKIIANITTGDLPRVEPAYWIRHRAMFTTPAATSTLMLVMSDSAPGGCGNDFALDDITFRECVQQVAQVVPKPTVQKKQTKPLQPQKQAPKKTKNQIEKQIQPIGVNRSNVDSTTKKNSVIKAAQNIFPSAPAILKSRENALVKKIETPAGEIKLDLYDNGEIDGDTVSIYHNNTLIKSHQRLSQKPITIIITIDPSQPHHELIMVAENLGSIPPNTSVMIVTTPTNRYQVFISSTEQKNAKVVFDLKE